MVVLIKNKIFNSNLSVTTLKKLTNFLKLFKIRTYKELFSSHLICTLVDQNTNAWDP